MTTLTREDRTAQFNSRDHEAFNEARFNAYVEEQVKQFCAALPQDGDFILQPDMTHVGINSVFYYISRVPAVRKITVYEIANDNIHVRLDSSFVVIANSEPTQDTTSNG